MDDHAFDPDRFGLDAEPRGRFDLDEPAQTRWLGRRLAQLVQPGAFIGLVGPLGGGKTTLVQALVAALDPEVRATSPTYTLLNRYETDPPVVHVDLYRLDSFDELETLAYWDYVESPGVITCVEWLDRLPGAWPRHGIIVLLERADVGRRASLWASDRWRDVVDELAGESPPQQSS